MSTRPASKRLRELSERLSHKSNNNDFMLAAIDAQNVLPLIADVVEAAESYWQASDYLTSDWITNREFTLALAALRNSLEKS